MLKEPSLAGLPQLSASSQLSTARILWTRIATYGWWPIVIGAIAMTATYPGRTHGLGMVTEPLLVDFGLSDAAGRVRFASLNFWATLIGASFCLPVGWLFDRLDRRLILVGNLSLLGLSVMWMATVHSTTWLFLCLILTRGLGQSALSVVSLTIVAKSFEPQRVGLAMAWYAVLSVPFHLVLIQGVGWALTSANVDWRTVWSIVGATLIGLSISAIGLERANKTSIDVLSIGPESETSWTLIEALRTPAFWVFSGTISIWGMIYAGVALFNVDIFKERGFDQQLYFHVLSLVTVVGLASKLIFGWLINYVSLPRLLATCLLMTAISLAALPAADQPWHAYAYGVVLGIASGAVALLFFATWRRLYGAVELGRIQGAAQMLTVFASASGPLLISYSKQLTSSYVMVFQIMAAVVFIMAVIAWFTPLPQKPDRVEYEYDPANG